MIKFVPNSCPIPSNINCNDLTHPQYYCMQFIIRLYKIKIYNHINQMQNKNKAQRMDQSKQSKQQFKTKKQRKLEKIRQKERKQKNKGQQQNNANVEAEVVKKDKKIKVEVQSQEEQSVSSSEKQPNQQLDFNAEAQGQDVMNVQFLVSQISENHYHSMKTILEKFARSTSLMSSIWADAVINNKQFGNLVDVAEEEQQGDQEEEQQQQEEENDEENQCHGLINLLPLNKKYQQISKKIRQSVKNSYQSTVQSNKFHQSPHKINVSEKLSNQNPLYLLINERAINLPAFVAVSMHKVLVNDINNMQQFQNKQNKKNLKQSYILGISQIQKIPQKKKHNNQAVFNPEDIIYSKFEDYQFRQNSDVWWIGETIHTAYKKSDHQKLYYLIKYEKYCECVEKKLEKLLIDG